MARDVEQLVLQLSADMRTFERTMLKAAGEADRAAARIERRFQQMNQQAVRDFQNFQNQVTTVIAAIGLSAIGADVVRLGDSWTRVGNALGLAGVESDSLAASQQIVADIALATRSDLEATAKLFSRLLRSSEDLGANLTDVAVATELVNKALAGASASERASATVQLGQGLASGRLQGDELRSILENSRPLAEAIAAEFETTVGNLRRLGAEGQLESRRVFEAILAAGPEIEAAFARTNATVEDSFTNLNTAAARWVGTSEATGDATRDLANLIGFVATNFNALADAAIIAAAVIGGTLAGAAVGQAIRALTTMATTARGASAALAFFGGPLGVAITGVGLALGFVATQTNLLADTTRTLQRANDDSASAFQTIINLSEQFERVSQALDEGADAAETLKGATDDAKDSTLDLKDSALDAAAALDDQLSSSADLTEQLSAQERQTRALALARLADARATIEQARASARAVLDTVRRDAIIRNLVPFDGVPFQPVAPLSDEQEAQVRQAQTDLNLYGQALEDISALQEDVRNGSARLRQEVSGGSNGGSNGNGGNADRQAAAARRQTIADLQEQAALSLARLQQDRALVATLEDAAEAERRTLAYQEAGLDLAAARSAAEAEVSAERAVANQQAANALELAAVQERLDLARAANQTSLVDAISDELELRRRITELIQLGLTADDAEARARAYVEAMRDAEQQTRDAQTAERDLQVQLETARARGDERGVEAAQRRLDLERRIAELRQLGFGEDMAMAQAEREIAALESAGIQNKFRTWFREGTLAALDGDLGSFFQNWLSDWAQRGLERALNDVADQLFAIFQNQITGIVGQGQGGLGGIIMNLVGSGAQRGLNKLGEDAKLAGDDLKGKLGAAAVAAAANAALFGSASAAAAGAEGAAAAQKSVAALTTTASLGRLAAAAQAATKALAQVAGTSQPGGSQFASFLSSLIPRLPSFGGFRANGGPVSPGFAYMVGERGPESFIPSVPGTIIPNGMFGGRTVQLVDNTVINIQGASTAEVQQLRSTIEQDLQTRQATTVRIVQEALNRRALR
jgi:tape measure domain-containing protein